MIAIWIQGDEERGPLFLQAPNLDLPLEPVPHEVEREGVVKDISTITSSGAEFQWSHRGAVYVTMGSDGLIRAVVETPLQRRDSAGRVSLASFLLTAGSETDISNEAARLADVVAPLGYELLPLPADLALRVGQLQDELRRARPGCLPVASWLRRVGLR